MGRTTTNSTLNSRRPASPKPLSLHQHCCPLPPLINTTIIISSHVLQKDQGRLEHVQMELNNQTNQGSIDT